MKFRFTKLIITLLLVVFLAGGYGVYTKLGRSVLVGDLRIDPFTEINPDKQYTLVLWESTVPFLRNEEAYRNAFVEAIEQFESTWPNIRVTIHQVPLEHSRDLLEEALQNGNPPDVYSMASGITKISDDAQVPIDPYISDESKGDFLPGVIQALTHERKIWAWPRSVLVDQWFVRKDIDEKIEEVVIGWTTDQFIEYMKGVVTKTGGYGVSLNPYDGQLLAQVMIASTGKNSLDENGERAWSTQELASAFQFFDRLIKEGLTDKNEARMSRSRLADFWNRNTVAIAPVTPPLMGHLLIRGGVVMSGDQHDDGPALVLAAPPPSFNRGSAGKFSPASVSGFAVFVSEPYKGNDHTKAAMLLAEHLSRTLAPVEASEIFAVPVHPSTLGRWQTDAGLSMKEANVLATWANGAVTPPIDDRSAQMQRRIIDEVLGVKLIELWQGGSPEEIAQDVADSIDGLRAMAKISSQPN